MTPTQRKAMEQALEALNDLRGYRQDIDDAIGALVEALAEQPAEQEPVAWVVDMNGTESLEWHSDVQADLIFGTAVQPLYTAPQPAKRVPLTGVQIRTWWASENGLEDCDMAKLDNFEKVVRSVERTHGITGEQN